MGAAGTVYRIKELFQQRNFTPHQS